MQAGSSAGGHHPSLRRSAQPVSRPAAANLCSFQSAISKREDLCRTENQYLIFRITLTPCGAGCVWPGGPGGWGGVTAAGADRGDTTQKSLHRPSPQPSPAPSPAQASPARVNISSPGAATGYTECDLPVLIFLPCVLYNNTL